MPVRQVKVSPAGKQFLRAGSAAFPRRVEECRESAAIHVLLAGLGCYLPRPVAYRTARIDVGAVPHEETHHLRLLPRGGPHERGLVAPPLACIDMGARPYEQRRGLDIAGPGNCHECGLPFRVG